MMNKNWKKTTLGELCDINMGQSPPSTTYNYNGEGLPFYQGVRDFGSKYPSPTVFCDVPRKIAEPLDVLLSVRAPIGAVNVAKEKCCIGRGLSALRHKKGNSKFLFYLMKHIQERWYAFDSQGTVFGCIGKDHISTFPVIVPKTNEGQQKIASILSVYDDLIELNERRIKILEEMARLIYKEWFVKFRFPGYEKVKMVKSKLGKIPKGWEVKGIFDIATVRYGENLPSKKMKKNGTYLVYGAAKVIGRYDEYNCENATVITGCRGSCGQMKITKPKSFVTNNSFIFDFSEEQKLFFYHRLMTRGLQDYIGGTAQPQITLESISGLTAMVPKEELVKCFNEIAIPIFKQIDLFDDVNTNLRQTRDMLLPKLVSGKIGVSNLDIKVS